MRSDIQSNPAPSQHVANDYDETIFKRISALAKSEAGLTIPDTKSAMVQSRVSRRLRSKNVASFRDYLAIVEKSGSVEERRELISVLTTNVSHFFRENHHFDTLQNSIIPNLIQRAKAGKKVRIWSAGCSSGQEPYSIVMTVLRSFPDAKNFDFRVLATDIDCQILSAARDGKYRADQVNGIQEKDLKRFFSDSSKNGAEYTVDPSVRELVSFKELNLHGPRPFTGQFDVIFCRNVVIYFDSETQNALWPRFFEALVPDGWLFLGHLERIQSTAQTKFENCGVTAYRRPAV